MRVYILDLVRFIAAISVVIYHYIGTPDSDFGLFTGIAQFGYLGVNLFFMISGFVIFSSAMNRSPSEFAISRIIRIYPMLWAGVLLTSIFILYYGGFEGRVSVVSIIANFTLLNQYLGIKNIDGVYWTLQLEIKFYFFIFALMAFKLINNYKVWLSLWLISTVLFLFCEQPFIFTWLLSPEYSGFFIAGIALYLIYQDGLNRFNSILLLLSTVLNVYTTFKGTGSFIEGAYFWQQVTSTVIILIITLLFYFISSKKLSTSKNSFIMTLGALTYPLYLFHNLIGKFLITHLSEFVSEGLSTIIIVIVMILLSFIMHKLIDGKFTLFIKKALEFSLSFIKKEFNHRVG